MKVKLRRKIQMTEMTEYWQQRKRASNKFLLRYSNMQKNKSQLNSSHPGRTGKINLNFIFTLLCGASKGFIKALNALNAQVGKC